MTSLLSRLQCVTRVGPPCYNHYINGLVQDYSNSITNALELLKSCTRPSIWSVDISVPVRMITCRYAYMYTYPDSDKIPKTALVWAALQRKFDNPYSNVIMSAMASKITGFSIACSGANQIKYQSSPSLAFARGIHRWPMYSAHKWAINAEIVSIWWRHHVRGHDQCTKLAPVRCHPII